MPRKTQKRKTHKKENGHWEDSFVLEVIEYAREHCNAAAIRKYKVPHTTFYGWMRNIAWRKGD